MERARIISMLARLAEIRGELDGWEAELRTLPGGREICDTAASGLIDMKWCLEDALAADGKAPEAP